MSTIPKESQDDLWSEVYRDFQDIFDYRQSSKQRDKWFEDVKKEYFVQRNDQLATDGREELEKEKFKEMTYPAPGQKPYWDVNAQITALQSSLKEKEKECEELKGLIARMYNEFIRAAENTSPAVSKDNWDKFQKINNL